MFMISDCECDCEAWMPRSVAERYLSERIVSRDYGRQIQAVASRLKAFTAVEANAYLKSRLEQVSPTTVCNERRVLRTLWTYAFETGLTDAPPRAILRVRQECRPVRAWTVDDLRDLVKAIKPWHGRLFGNGVDKGVWLEVWVRLAYDTGARYGDLFSWTTANVRHGLVEWTTNKTNVPCSRRLRPETRLAVGELAQNRRKCGLDTGRVVPILGGVCCRRQSFKILRCVLDQAGLEGSGKWLRRSAATHVEQQRPGAGSQFLGHKTPGLAARHYLDQSQLQVDLPVPWPLLTDE